MKSKSLAAIVLLCTVSFAPARIITGIVKDINSKSPVSNVKVSVDSAHFTISDKDGKFSLNTEGAVPSMLLKTQQQPWIEFYSRIGSFSISGYTGDVLISIQNIKGQTIARYSTVKGSTITRFPISNLPMGVYFITLTNNSWKNVYKAFNIGRKFTISNPIISQNLNIVPSPNQPNQNSLLTAPTTLFCKKDGYGNTVKAVGAHQNEISILLQRREKQEKIRALAKTLFSGKEIVIGEATREFPLSRPGEKISIQKVFKDNKIIIKSNSPNVKSATDLVSLETQEFEVKHARYGAMSDGLINKISTLKDSDSIRVVVYLKIQPPNASMLDMDPYKYRIDVLKTKALSLIHRGPVVSKSAFLSRHGINEIPIKDKKISAKSEMFSKTVETILKKDKLSEVCFDNDVASVDEIANFQLCSSLCPCNGLQYNDCFSSLATSAINSDSGMPSYAGGYYVSAATWESGLRQKYLYCKHSNNELNNLICSSLILDDSAAAVEHSEATFQALANAAGWAYLWHHGDTNAQGLSFYDSMVITSLYGINVISLSVVPPFETQNNPEHLMKQYDLWSYQWPYPTIFVGAANDGFCRVPKNRCYNAINVGNVQHTGETHFILTDTSTPCSVDNLSQARNPAPRYGGLATDTFDCSAGCSNVTRSDRELPLLVAPGIGPNYVEMSDPCILAGRGMYPDLPICLGNGTSYSTPTAAGMCARAMSTRPWEGLPYSPEAMRVVMLATAQNVDDKEWGNSIICPAYGNPIYLNKVDGRDGAGVVSGAAAAEFAYNMAYLINFYAWAPNAYPPPELNGIVMRDSLTTTDTMSGYTNTYIIAVPDTLPAGKHLRIVLTWSSSPCENEFVNDLSDLDLFVCANDTFYMSTSLDGNVELVDVPNSDLIQGGSNCVWVCPYNPIMRIPACAFSQKIYWSLGWTWVKDHAP